MRHTLEMKTVAALVNTKLGKGCALVRARYLKGMQKMGYTWDEARQCYEDVFAVAELQVRAQ